MKTSLISVTFRKKSVEEIVDIACKGGLSAIEWGGDKHVVPGDTQAIQLAKTLCAERGLSISAYGSYYRCNDDEDFTPVLETALALGTKIIRVYFDRLPDFSSTIACRCTRSLHLLAALLPPDQRRKPCIHSGSWKQGRKCAYFQSGRHQCPYSPC